MLTRLPITNKAVPIDEDGSGDSIDRKGIVNMDITANKKKRKNIGSQMFTSR